MEWLKNKIKEFKEDRAKLKEARKEIRADALDKQIVAERKEAMKFEEFKAKDKYDRRKKAIKSGGILGSLSKSLQESSKNMNKRPASSIPKMFELPKLEPKQKEQSRPPIFDYKF